MLLLEINKDTMRYKNKLKVINHIMEKNNITMDLRLRIKEYLRFSWETEKNQLFEEESKVLSEIPSNLRKEFLLASYGELLSGKPMFFENFSKKCLNETIYKGYLKELRFAPGDIIFDDVIYFFIFISIFKIGGKL